MKKETLETLNRVCRYLSDEKRSLKMRKEILETEIKHYGINSHYVRITTSQIEKLKKNIEKYTLIVNQKTKEVEDYE